jgi:uncharacterized protein YqfA (UPF0365 family)
MNRRPSVFQLLVGTLIHKVPYFETRRCLQRIEGHGLPLSYTELAAHHLAGGRITSLVEGLIYAQERGIKISVTSAAARDLVEAYGSKTALSEHIRVFESRGVRDLDSAPLNVAQLKNA